MSKSRPKKTADIVADAAAVLRKARDLMNHGGRHWIKGAEKMLVDPETHTPGDQGVAYPGSRRPGYEPAYCSIGAIRETGPRTDTFRVAAIALAEAIDPERMRDERESIREFYSEEEGYDPRSEDVRFWIEDHMVEQANDIIIGHNDDSYTEWGDVRSAFTKAAGRLADRARKRKAVA